MWVKKMVLIKKMLWLVWVEGVHSILVCRSKNGLIQNFGVNVNDLDNLGLQNFGTSQKVDVGQKQYSLCSIPFYCIVSAPLYALFHS